MDLPDEKLKQLLQTTNFDNVPDNLEDKIMARVQHVASYDRSIIHVLGPNYSLAVLLLGISAIIFLLVLLTPNAMWLTVVLSFFGSSAQVLLDVLKSFLGVFSVACLLLAGIPYVFHRYKRPVSIG